MAVTTREAIQQLRDAISTVRGCCGADPGCRDLLKACSQVEDAALTVSYGNQMPEQQPGAQLQKALDSAEKAVKQMFGDTYKDDDGPEPTSLKEAASETRRQFADKRKSAV